MSDIEQRVAARLRSLREARDFSARELALRAHVTTEMVTRAERGERTPSILTLERLCDALGVTLAEFFAETAPRGTKSQYGVSRLEELLRPLDRETREEVVGALTPLLRRLGHKNG